MNLIIILLIALLTTQCSLIKRSQDGPPNYEVDVTNIKSPTPKYEKPSKYGNPKTYTVMGKTYKVLKSNKNFNQSGIASWYGTKFNGKLTSNREKYNMLLMTAAHKTLPLPSYVRVTRTDTGQSIIVRVNDRGPFVDNRIIDLSYAAAKKLGMLKYGTAPVQISTINTDNTLIQAGAFKTEAGALQQQRLIKTKTGLYTKIKSINNWYKLELGPFSNQLDVSEVKQQLQAIGINTLTRKYSS